MEVSNLSAETLKEIQTYNVNEATMTSEYRTSPTGKRYRKCWSHFYVT